MKVFLDTASLEDYKRFLAIKALPRSRIVGHVAEFPDEYASRLGMQVEQKAYGSYTPPSWMFDYQRDITALAIRKRKFAVFAECGTGKTAIFLEYALNAAEQLPKSKRVLIVSPLMVVQQTIDEANRFYGKYPVEKIPSSKLQSWLAGEGQRIGITNYEAIKENLDTKNLGALILDESSLLKSHYGRWGTRLIKMGRGLEWKLALTGTPAPNDRIEYANHAVLLDAFPTVNSFLAKYFVNKGKTQERWEMKAHALRPFYLALSHWCIFLSNPATYGWKDNVGTIQPIHVHMHDVSMTKEQHDTVYDLTGSMFAAVGGITSRQKFGQIAKGNINGKAVKTNKPAFIRDLVAQWEKEESTIIWCLYNPEQNRLAKIFPDAGNIDGKTPLSKRIEIIDRFKSGDLRTLITKAKILGFGQNMQVCTRQVFSGCQDSYELFWQAVKRSNRVGSKHPLNVHIPATEIEIPMIENVMRKARRVQEDTETQERIFKECCMF